jgi:lycopene cyclase domain-containing protein
MGLLYLLALAIALTGMVMLDRRFGLFFWRAPWRAAVVLLVGVVFFLIWDLGGVLGNIFFRGETAFMTGLQIFPEIPLEEVFFLTLLCYLTMNVYFAASDLIARMFSSRAHGTTPAQDGNVRANGGEA